MSNYATINPATGERVAEFPSLSDEDVQDVLKRSFTEYREWRSVPLAERTAILSRVAELHRERSDELAALLTLEVGKTTAEAKGEVALVASIYEYYADNAERFLREEPLDVKGPGRAVVRTEPIGPLVGIMPWNFPYYQVARFAAPNIALGNTVMLKHSRNCPQSALAIEAVFRDAGLPGDVYINAFATSGQIATMIADPRVQGVSLTGSEKAGSAVAEVAGRHLKKYVLELGGSDPFIVLPDADLDKAVTGAVSGRMYNGGQACTASKRFIIVGDIYDEFLERYTEAMSRITPGDPTDAKTTFGPLSSQSAVEEIDELVQDAVAKGATASTGGAGPDGPGAYYPATVLTGVTPQMRAYSEEIFGPAAVVFHVDSPEAAIDLANDSPYGLSSSIYTADVDYAQQLADQLETGMVWINSISRSAPDLPFGGVKRSGVGRELAQYGINEFANKKLVRIPKA
ncbi:NAD-dependent succinate-semialdehyde dehydrogenase [Pseudarthrobacter sulfonivorans]|uniref:NAD-dependent succinate-semialdehyde dehydrogenase n=1 Tax=Pseudarthrobacter sulfonivorans TaxID=121292 RepID=UPI0028555256|nr:NAD-dependent succinate-semialdehyde dehydrogenase [Pseudarthrobacter sulfonivorans]MDR6417505.1 succinate-semialdehyde dehydrogenase/glutarate-semialdehyde dehydrogenase [Pseudarthrobacter sulfonivorans]